MLVDYDDENLYKISLESSMMASQVQHVPAGSVADQTLTFSNKSFFGDVYMTSSERTLTSDDLTTLVDDLLEFTGGDASDGYFGITQNGASWFGHGMGTFVDLISKQYNSLPDGRSEHKREMATWVGPGGPHAGTMVLSGQPLTGSKAVDRFIVTLVTKGYPINLQFLNKLSELPFEFGNAHEWDPQRYKIKRAGRVLLSETDVDQEIISDDIDSQIDEIVCRNPWFNRANDLEETLGLQEHEGLSRMCQTLAKYEQIRAHVLPPYYPKENPDNFKIKRFELMDLSDLTAVSVGTVNVRVDARPNL